jgi:hypothetical protein
MSTTGEPVTESTYRTLRDAQIPRACVLADLETANRGYGSLADYHDAWNRAYHAEMQTLTQRALSSHELTTSESDSIALDCGKAGVAPAAPRRVTMEGEERALKNGIKAFRATLQNTQNRPTSHDIKGGR